MRIGITGATGILGQGLCDWLLHRRVSLVILARDTQKASDFFSQLDKGQVEIIQGDITDSDSLKQFVRGLDACVHLAALVNFGSWQEYYKVNVDGTTHLCQSIIKYNPACHLIFASTISSLEITFWNRIFTTKYARSKYLAESKINDFRTSYDLKATIFYPGYIYGPYDNRFIPSVIKFLRKKNAFLVSGGESNAPVIFIFDVCELIEKMINNSSISIGKKYLAVKSQPWGMHHFFSKVAQRSDLNIPRKKYSKFALYCLAVLVEVVWSLIKKNPPIARRHIHALTFNKFFDPTLAKKELSWIPSTDVDTGLSEAFQWLKKFEPQIFSNKS